MCSMARQEQPQLCREVSHSHHLHAKPENGIVNWHLTRSAKKSIINPKAAAAVSSPSAQDESADADARFKEETHT